MVMTRVTINGVRLPVRGSIRYVMRWVRAALLSLRFGEHAMNNKSKRAQYMRERYTILKEHGICVRCGKASAVPGATLCWACRLWNNQRRSGSASAPKSPYEDGRRSS